MSTQAILFVYFGWNYARIMIKYQEIELKGWDVVFNYHDPITDASMSVSPHLSFYFFIIKYLRYICETRFLKEIIKISHILKCNTSKKIWEIKVSFKEWNTYQILLSYWKYNTFAINIYLWLICKYFFVEHEKKYSIYD